MRAGKGKYFSTNPEYAASEYGSKDAGEMFAVFVAAVAIGNVVPASNEDEYNGECLDIESPVISTRIAETTP